MRATTAALKFLLQQTIPSLHGDLRDQAKVHVAAVEAEAETQDLDNELGADLLEVMAAAGEQSGSARTKKQDGK